MFLKKLFTQEALVDIAIIAIGVALATWASMGINMVVNLFKRPSGNA